MRFLFPGLALLLWAAALPARADLKSSLGLFFELAENDSVTALVQKSETELQVEAVDITTTEPKTYAGEVGAKPMAKLLSQARAAGVSVTEWTPTAAKSPAETAKSDTAEDPKSPAGHPAPRSGGSNFRNRMWYMAYQVPLSTWVFGSSIPLAMEVDNYKVHVAMPLLIAPVAFGGHLWFSKSRPFEDAHFYGTRYLSLAALYASYAVPYALMDAEEDPNQAFRTAVVLSLGLYPLGLWGGYELGNKYLDLPGRIETQAKFATGFGTLGFFSPFLYFDDIDANIDNVIRLGLGQSVAFAAAGHFLSQYYRAGENIPGGVTTGILTHSALGVGLGLEVAALSDADKVRPWLGAALAGGTIGFMEGLWYFRDRNDGNDRAFYNLLGTAAGMSMGGGILILTESDASDYVRKVTISSLLVGGALLGYIASDLLTGTTEKRPASGPSRWTDGLAFNPIPLPEPQLRDNGKDREVRMRYRVPGLSYRF